MVGNSNRDSELSSEKNQRFLAHGEEGSAVGAAGDGSALPLPLLLAVPRRPSEWSPTRAHTITHT